MFSCIPVTQVYHGNSRIHALRGFVPISRTRVVHASTVFSTRNPPKFRVQWFILTSICLLSTSERTRITQRCYIRTSNTLDGSTVYIDLPFSAYYLAEVECCFKHILCSGLGLQSVPASYAETEIQRFACICCIVSRKSVFRKFQVRLNRLVNLLFIFAYT